MRKRICVNTIVCLCIMLNYIHAQGTVIEAADKARVATGIADSVGDGRWIYGGRFQLSLNQSYSNNWMGSSSPYIGLSTLDRIYIYYRSNKLSWENTFDIDFGMRYTFHKNNTPKVVYEKTSDKAEFNSQLGFKAKGYWYYGGLLNIYTQVANGWDATNKTRTSSFMTPGYFTLSIGMNYKRKRWGFYIAPVAAKLITKIDNSFYQQIAFGVDSNKKSHLSVGAFLRVNFDADIHPKIHLNTKFELFYDYMGEYAQMRNALTNYEMTWRFSITEWLSISFKAALLYDYNIRFPVYEQDGITVIDGMTTDHLQFQETFGLTLGYKFRYSKK
ncbi:MAG: DUF3078 domain-containing protein [Bacteroidales bacterium]|nr:DUF3078 domain-containing protein [Bacteroidales bacterium]